MNYCSCFLVKTRLELAAVGSELYELASAKLSEIEALYESYLEKKIDKTMSRQRATILIFHIFGYLNCIMRKKRTGNGWDVGMRGCRFGTDAIYRTGFSLDPSTLKALTMSQGQAYNFLFSSKKYP